MQILDIEFRLRRPEMALIAQVNSVRLSGTLILFDDVKLEASGSVNAPIIIPVARVSGPVLTDTVKVSARLSGGIGSLAISIGGCSVLSPAWN